MVTAEVKIQKIQKYEKIQKKKKKQKKKTLRNKGVWWNKKEVFKMEYHIQRDFQLMNIFNASIHRQNNRSTVCECPFPTAIENKKQERKRKVYKITMKHACAINHQSTTEPG